MIATALLRFSLVLLAGLSLVSASHVFAAAGDTFHARVAVEDQGTAAREQAMRDGLVSVLIRASGRSDIAEDEAVEDVLAQAARFVRRFQYDRDHDALYLDLHYESDALQRAFAERQIAVWREDRPPVLVWLAIDGGGERMLLGAHEREVLRAPIVSAARDFGITLLFPLLDIEDMNAVRFSDVWGGFTDTVARASERYGTPVVLLARVYRDGGVWHGRWRMLDGGGTWQSRAASLDQALTAGVGESLASRLRVRYAHVPGLYTATDVLHVDIGGVRSLDDYLDTERYLSRLGGVSEVRVVGADADAATFRLDITGDAQRVVTALRRDGRLREREPEPEPYMPLLDDEQPSSDLLPSPTGALDTAADIDPAAEPAR